MLCDLIGSALYNRILEKCNGDDITEIRLRKGRRLAYKTLKGRFFVEETVTDAMLKDVVARATKYSLYAYQEEISEGYIPYDGGIRIGVLGQGVVDGKKLLTYKNITSLNIRVPHEIIGCAASLYNQIIKDFQNTLIVSPPYGGKTTLIRDMARMLSENYDVTLIDERNELVADGFHMGELSDVASNVPKTLAVEGIIRTMSPEIIVLDELSPARDLEAIENISRSGVKVLASIHSDSISKLMKSEPELVGHFKYGVLLSNKPRVGHIKSVVKFREDTV